MAVEESDTSVLEVDLCSMSQPQDCFALVRSTKSAQEDLAPCGPLGWDVLVVRVFAH